VLRKRVVVLVAATVMVLSMFAASAPVFAQGEGGCDANPGESEGSRSPLGTPPQGKNGQTIRDTTANEHDLHGSATGFGQRVDECA
jgi:hypothetical protein